MKHWENEEFVAKDLVVKIIEKEILVPQYQRGQVWEEDAQKKLIDSIKKGFPFGTILLYFDKDDHKYRLIDGLQRCTTISKYLNNPSLIFDKNVDVDPFVVNEIISLVPVLAGNIDKIKKTISNIIESWVLNTHANMPDIQKMQYARCARAITNEFPSFSDYTEEIEDLIEPMLEKFKVTCNELSTTKIPAIVYKGEQNDLPEIFTRINAEGTKLSKYQILAATWSHIDFKVESEQLKDIHSYVETYFVNLLSDDKSFTLEESIKEEKTLNLFQILFGFSKILSAKYEYLFSGNGESEVESAAFNLVTACIGLKNNNLKNLDEEIKKHFSDDSEFNLFLEKILNVTNRVDNILKAYLSFKSNTREGSKIIYYHTEMQICSIIANTFIAKHVNLFDENQLEVFEINLERNNKNWKNHDKSLSKNLIKKYLVDILDKAWRGSGDNKLNEVVIDQNYYTREYDKDKMKDTLNKWYFDHQHNTKERSKITSPSKEDKLILSIIYAHTFSSAQHSNDTKYDIEHLATKNIMKKYLSNFDKRNSEYRLPISSIGNLCLLPENSNRRKRDLTLYQDKAYKTKVKETDLSIEDIEKKNSFTKLEDFYWIEESYSDFTYLKNSYINFIDHRFDIMSNKIIENLYGNQYWLNRLT